MINLIRIKNNNIVVHYILAAGITYDNLIFDIEQQGTSAVLSVSRYDKNSHVFSHEAFRYKWRKKYLVFMCYELKKIICLRVCIFNFQIYCEKQNLQNSQK